SGSKSSSVSPSARRCLNAAVLACSSESGSVFKAGSKALTFVTVLFIWRSRRSLRLPKMPVRMRLSMGCQTVGKRDCGAGIAGRQKRRPPMIRRPPDKTSQLGLSGALSSLFRGAVDVAERVHGAAIQPYLEVAVRPGRAAGLADLGDDVAG